jgi:hypothetical protein
MSHLLTARSATFYLLIVVTDILLSILNADAINVLLRYQLASTNRTFLSTADHDPIKAVVLSYEATDATRRSMVPSGWTENGLYNTRWAHIIPFSVRKNNFPSLFQPIYAL